MKHGKKYVDNAKLIDRDKTYDIDEAIATVVKTATAKFDETVELHVRLGVDGRHADQQVRGALVLPNGTGKNVKVLAICKGPNEDAAKEAGADFVGAEDMTQKIQTENWMDFDVLVTTPDCMGLVGRLGKILGPRGLMPNPKAGTVTPDIARAVKEAKAGKIEYRLDKTILSTARLVRQASAKLSLKRTSTLLWKLLLRLSPLPLRVSILSPARLHLQWDRQYVSAPLSSAFNS